MEITEAMQEAIDRSAEAYAEQSGWAKGSEDFAAAVETATFFVVTLVEEGFIDPHMDII